MSVRNSLRLAATIFVVVLLPRVAFGLDGLARDRILASQTRLAAALLARTPIDRSDGAVMVSPASLAGMLSPLTIAGDEAHRAAMAEVLQIAPGATRLDDLDAIRGAAVAGTPGDAVETSTRFVFAPSSPPTPVAAQRLARAGVETVDADPASTETQAANDAWVSKVTHGKITEVDPAPPGSALATFNALYFNGGWAEPFSEAKTAPADFHAANGDRFRVPFMHSGDLFSSSCREDARFVAVDLPFFGDRYSMVVLTTKDAPADLASFADHLAWLDGEQFRPTAVIIDLPRFGASSKTNLLPLLVGLGLDPTEASVGLSAITPPLGAVVQKVKLNIFEYGAEVVALTEGFSPRGSLRAVNPAEVIVDKPFAFSLRDRESGLMIAAGFVSRVGGDKLEADVPAISAQSPPPPQPTAEMKRRRIEQRRALEGAPDQGRKVQP